MRAAATHSRLHLVGIIAVLSSAVLAVAVSPVWLLATAVLATINLVRYTVHVSRTGHLKPTIIPLALLNIVLLTGAVAFALTPH
ncbi:hypothetical protein [Microbacterium sp. RURRCA19A]|uniref:hypothetical protein n=1 Tax=Microbacterium sp. RURRCA19A TaxID=1907391 RepID=UPI00095718E5|nr:hypothetical protein [Microbacterium sp. RURRCA19A]SIS19983.1 hypothetical protein SAMN05880568_3497 [Microbacterium sp. RURRCA19A]